MKNYSNLGQLLDYISAKFPERYIFGEKTAGKYHWMTYSHFSSRVGRLRQSIYDLGLKKGDRVALIANNSIAWATTAYAAYGLGAILVPMYEVQKSSDWEFIINSSGARFLFVSTQTIYEKVKSLSIPNVEKVFCFSQNDENDESNFSNLILKQSQEMAVIDINEDEIADILYTSGTTGMPKGVVLSHKNIVYNAKSVQSLFEVGEKDIALSFLPWAHAFGKTVELHTFVSFGAAIGIAESTRTIAQNLLEVNPTIVNSVPKIFNKIYDTIHMRMSEEAWISRTIFERAQDLCKRQRISKLSLAEMAQYKTIVPLVGKKIRQVFGSRIRFCICGGAPLAQEIAEFFDGFGIPIYEGYGMTETAPIITVNCPAALRYGSVGRALPYVKVKIDAPKGEQQGEILTSGPCVMKGYYQAPENDAEIFISQDELRTGDMGYLDDDGFLWITGRVKEQYKLENGKYVVPTILEMKINASPIIEQSVVFGAGRPYNIALIQASDDFIKKMRAELKLENASTQEVEKDEKILEIIDKEIKRLTQDFRGYERPQAFFLTLEALSIENGLLSPSLKIKRKEVEKKYAARIEELYRRKSR